MNLPERYQEDILFYFDGKPRELALYQALFHRQQVLDEHVGHPVVLPVGDVVDVAEADLRPGGPLQGEEHLLIEQHLHGLVTGVAELQPHPGRGVEVGPLGGVVLLPRRPQGTVARDDVEEGLDVLLVPKDPGGTGVLGGLDDILDKAGPHFGGGHDADPAPLDAGDHVVHKAGRGDDGIAAVLDDGSGGQDIGWIGHGGSSFGDGGFLRGVVLAERCFYCSPYWGHRQYPIVIKKCRRPAPPWQFLLDNPQNRKYHRSQPMPRRGKPSCHATPRARPWSLPSPICRRKSCSVSSRRWPS